MLGARLIVWVISSLSGLVVSYIFALLYAPTSSSAVILVFSAVATAIWIFALIAPLVFPIYKGILPALFPMMGLLLFGLLGFAIGWFLAGFFQCIADFQRYAHLSEITGGAPPAEIIPLQAIGILFAGLAIGIWFVNQGCPWFQSGEEFLVTLTHKFFIKESPETRELVSAISLIGFFFAGTRQFFLIIMATLFPRPQIPRIP
jgi:hypothetical protein